MRFIVVEKIYGIPREVLNASVHFGNQKDVPELNLSGKDCYVFEVDEKLKIPNLLKYRLHTEKNILNNADVLPDRNLDNTDSTGLPISKQAAFANSEGMRFRGVSFGGIAINSSSTDIDFKITEERYINGGFLVLKDQSFGDTFTFQIVDIDNITGYGAGVILDQFITNYYVNVSSSMQNEILLDYPAKIIAGLYLRLKYNSVGTNNVAIGCNLYLHKK